MKLYELTGVKSLHGYAISDLIEYFIAQTGYSFKGEGASATVFKHPTKNEIIKFWVVDDAYDHFIKHAMANQDDPHIVKILQRPKQLTMFHKRPTKDDDGDAFPSKLSYVRLEMLTPIKRTTKVYGVAIGPLLNILYEAYADSDPAEFSKFDITKLPSIAKLINKESGISGDIDTEGLQSFFESFGKMYQHFGKEFNYDLHEGNVMLRGNVPVIIDPFADTFSMHTTSNFNFYSQRNNVEHAKEFATGPIRKGK